jgi:hypothetical protein
MSRAFASVVLVDKGKDKMPFCPGNNRIVEKKKTKANKSKTKTRTKNTNKVAPNCFCL